MSRSNRREVRNPILALPAAKHIREMPAHLRHSLAFLLEDLHRDAKRRADESWTKHKAPMAAYWKAVAVYARHIKRVLREEPES